MTILEAANQLGKMLEESSEFVRMRTADQAQQADSDAQLLLMAYNQKRTELMMKAQKEDITPEEMQNIRNEMEAEFNKLNKNASIVEYIDSMQVFNDLMQQVNAAVTSYVSPKQDDCGGDCGGCGGGCH